MHFRRLTVVAGAALCALAASTMPALTADNTATLRKALSHMPETALATDDPMPIAFLDVKALAAVEKGALSKSALRRLSFGNYIKPVDALQYGFGKDWTEKAGIPIADISYFAGYGMPPARLAYWGLADETMASALLDTLAPRGFKEVQPTPRMLANGDPRAINLGRVDPANPWLGALGQTSFVMAHADAVVQATAPEDFEATLEMTRSVAENPAIAILLDGLAKAPVSKDATLVQALVITPLFGMSAVDPADLMQSDLTDLDATKKKLEEKMAEASKGIPPYLAGIMVDAQQEQGPALLISLAYVDCFAAETAVATIQARWKASMGMSRVADMAGQLVPTANKTCAAVVSFTAKGPVNEPLRYAFDGAMTRKFNVLQIGASE